MKTMKLRPMGWFLKTITFGWADAICLAPFAVYIHPRRWDSRYLRTVDHEEVHWLQQIELYIVALILSTSIQLVLLFQNIFAWWFIPFVLCPFAFYYVIYLVEWLIKLPFYGKRAYMNISFEREAYSRALWPKEYKRNRFNWIIYIWK